MSDHELRSVVESAMDAQQTVHQLFQREAYQRYIAEFFRLEGRVKTGDEVTTYISMTTTLLEMSEVFAVVDDMRDLIESGAEQMPDDFVLHRSDMVSPCGFIYFESGEGPTIKDSNDQDLVLGAIAYACVRIIDDRRNVGIRLAAEDPDHIMIMPFTNMTSDRDMSSENVAGLFDAAVGTSLERVIMDHVSFSPMPPAMLPFEASASDAFDPRNPNSDAAVAGVRVLFAILKFLGEKWVDHRRLVPSRAARRRAQRELERDEVVTRIVRLRRAVEGGKATDDEVGDVEWSCRWFVRGHWREWSPGKFCWVRPHVKGPEDKPIRAVDRAYGVVR